MSATASKREKSEQKIRALFLRAPRALKPIETCVPHDFGDLTTHVGLAAPALAGLALAVHRFHVNHRNGRWRSNWRNNRCCRIRAT